MIINGAAVQEGITGVGCTIAGTEQTECASNGAAAIFETGNLISLRMVPVGGPTDPAFVNWTVQFVGK